jgi:micrococcal nuclease
VNIIKACCIAMILAASCAASACAGPAGSATTLGDVVTTSTVTSGGTVVSSVGSPAAATTTSPALAPDTSLVSPTTLSTDAILPGTSTSTTAGEDAQALVLKVVDGDTIRVRMLGGDFPGSADGATEEVRIIGIDAPETGEAFSAAATAALKSLCGGKKVGLEADTDTRDQYGRLLAYVFLENGTFVDGEMLRLGLATLYLVSPNDRFEDELEDAQAVAEETHAGIWAANELSPLAIATVNYNPPGDDTQNLNGEYVVFRVLTAGSLKGYAVEDASGKHFDFPSRIYQKGQTITLHSGRGNDTASDLYWGVSGSAIWNNDGDTVKVLDPQGHIVAVYTYPSAG